VHNNPLKYVDPTGHWAEIDDLYEIRHIYSKEDIGKLKEWTGYFETAQTNEQRQAAHDGSNAIRLKYSDSVIRYDFLNGKNSTMVYKTSTGGIGDTESGLVAEPYMKGQIGITVVGTLGLQAKMQSGEMSISIIKGLNGEIGAQLTVSGGVSINNGGNIEHSIKNGHSKGMFYFVEGEVSNDLEDADWEAVFGGGAGFKGSIPIIPTGGNAYEHEISLAPWRTWTLRVGLVYTISDRG
jgi:hypothetical protein